ncbi:MAG: DUF5995 family protein [Actinomycetota bacterium]|nr:DUF5995 family protein [Actinomycetota bacterium]
MPGIEEVIRRMENIGAGLPAADGVARFNALYLAVTREVAVQARGGRFEDPEALALLDVVFADLYFAAVADVTAGRKANRAWAPLFDARKRKRVAAIQFALAGMNAHINHDLVLAIVETCRRLDRPVKRRSALHRDYLAVNKLLEKVEARVKREFLTGDLALADEALGRLDDVLAMWSVARARDAAWTWAETLSQLPKPLRKPFLDTLAGNVGLAGRGLLIPVR